MTTLAGLLARESSLRPAFPGALSQWRVQPLLAAYSCGGSRGFGAMPAPRSLFTNSAKSTAGTKVYLLYVRAPVLSIIGSGLIEPKCDSNEYYPKQRAAS